MAVNNTPTASTSKSKKRLTLALKTFSSIYEYFSDDGGSHKDRLPAYIINTSSFTRGKPDLSFHDGPDESHPVVACAWMPATRSYTIGIGDFTNSPGNIEWEEFKQESRWTSEFSWGLNLPSGRVNLKWKGTSHHAVEGSKVSSWSSRNWKLVDACDNDDIIAVFTGKPGITSVCGTLQFNVDWGLNFERMVLLTVVLMNRHENM